MIEARDPFLIGFSSMGAPELNWGNLAALARDLSMDFVELRTLGGTTRLPEYFAANPGELANRRFPIRLLASDLWLAKASEEDISRFLEYARLADALDAPYVRVFGGGEMGTPLDPGLLDRAVKTVQRCREEMFRLKIRSEMLLETHSGFSSSATCLQFSERLSQPLCILWDAHHTWKLAGESPEETWNTIGPLVRHIHYKDSQSQPSSATSYSYTFPGEGEFPSGEFLRLLRSQQYCGGVSLEWERLWHPELPELSEALQAFLSLLRPQRKSAS